MITIKNIDNLNRQNMITSFQIPTFVFVSPCLLKSLRQGLKNYGLQHANDTGTVLIWEETHNSTYDRACW